MSRTLSTKDLARRLGVSEQTIRYHARKGTFPYDPTPGGHRRFDLGEVQDALRGIKNEPGSFPRRGERLDLTSPSGELTPTMRFELQATAGYDEGRFENESERLELPDFMDVFAVPGSARYPQQSHAVGAGA